MLTSLSYILDFLTPRFCYFCHKEGELICPRCLSSFPLAELKCPICFKPSIDGSAHPRCTKKLGLDGLTSVYRYRDSDIENIIKAIKYHYFFKYIEVLLRDNNLAKPQADILVPLPLHWRRLYWRGFNQAEEICKVLQCRWNLPYLNLLERQKATKPLAEISSSKLREEQIKDAFCLNQHVLKDPEKMKNMSVILVDDVFTSGASLGEACRVLKKNGVAKVWGWTIAA